MEYKDVVQHLGACGLDCARCADYQNGEIKLFTQKVAQLLGNYERLAQMKAKDKPIFNNYSHFKEILDAFAQASCSGCRGENVQCPLTTCSARTCSKEKGVYFCFECDEYPCEKQFSGRLRDLWKKINDRMKEIGAVEYYYEQLNLPRY